MKNDIETFNNLYSKNDYYLVQKAYTTPHFLVFTIRFPGKSVACYIGRGNQYQGFFLSEKIPPSFLRIQDRLLEYFRKKIVGTKISRIKTSETKFVFGFNFKNDKNDNQIWFGYKDRQLFFVIKEGDSIFDSSTGVTKAGEVSEKMIEADSYFETNYTIEKYLEAETKKNGGALVVKKREKFLIKKINNIPMDLEKVKKWRGVAEGLENNTIDLNLLNLKIHEQEFKFKSHQDEWERKNLIYLKIKKLKKAEEILKTRKTEAENELVKVKSGEIEIEVTKEKAIQPLWITQKNKSKLKNDDFNIDEFSFMGLNGIIGKDSKANDYLREISNKNHYWFHIDNYPGSHLILKTDDISKIELKNLSLIASMLRDYSKLEIMEIPVVFTQLKNIKGKKGSRGEVIITKPKYLRCDYTLWKEIITIVN